MNKISKGRVVLAFSGGLDTSFCAVWLREELGLEVVTATVDTGGFAPEELEAIARRSRELKAAAHHLLDARGELFSRFISYLIKGNVLRGRAYPLSVSAERVVQAELVARLAKDLGAVGLAHGSTGAGNDQFRFDGIFQAAAPGLEVHTPIRELGWTREREVEYLAHRGVAVGTRTAAYSVNAGLWGTTVGGRETHDPWLEIPEVVFPAGLAREAAPVSTSLGFERGLPVSIDGEALQGVELVARLNVLGRRLGIGRGIHIGDTVVGIKGRIAFEAPAPLMLIAAHRELEKLVLTRWQQFWKDHLADFYGQLLHEGLYLDPVMRDIEAMMDSSQAAVTGEVRLRLSLGRFDVTGARSPYSLMDAGVRYGETAGSLWSGADAASFARLRALPMTLAQRAREKLGA